MRFSIVFSRSEKFQLFFSLARGTVNEKVSIERRSYVDVN